jgi:hypothetical protein
MAYEAMFATHLDQDKAALSNATDGGKPGPTTA